MELIRLGTLNIRSAKKKTEKLLEMMKEYKWKVFVMTETWFKDAEEAEMTQQNMEKEGYVFYFSNRRKKKGGGIGICVTDEMRSKRVGRDVEWKVSVEVEISEEEKIRVIGVYIEPNIKTKDRIAIIEELMEEVAECKDKILIMGDINANLEEKKNTKTKQWTDILEEQDLMIMNGERGEESERATRRGQVGQRDTTIDWVITRRDGNEWIKRVEVREEDMIRTDHRSITVEIETTQKLKRVDAERTGRKWKRSTENTGEYETRLTELLVDWENNNGPGTGTETMWKEWREAVEKALEEKMKRNNRSFKKKKNVVIMEMIKRKQAIRRKLKDKRNRGEEIGEDERKRLREYESQIQREMLKEEEREVEKRNTRLQEVKSRDMGLYWKLLKNWAGTQKKATTMKVIVEGVAYEGEEAANKYRGTLMKPEREETIYLKEIDRRLELIEIEEKDGEAKESKSGEGENYNRDITEAEITTTLKRMKNGKAPSEEGFAIEHLKMGGQQMLRAISRLFSHIWKEEKMPEWWRRTTIVPIKKEKKGNEEVKYRPIALIHVMAKIYTAILAKRVSDYLEEEQKLSEAQAGFRKGRGTIDHLFILTELIKGKMRRNECTEVTFLDLEQAYDSIPRRKLWVAVHDIGIKGKMWRVMRDIYRRNEMRVRVGESLSEPFTVNVGVRQGCPLSPVLFNIFINELANKLNPERGLRVITMNGEEAIIPSLFFADDICLLTKTRHGTREQVRICDKFATDNNIKFNVNKCAVMIFDPKDSGKGGLEIDFKDENRDGGTSRKNNNNENKVRSLTLGGEEIPFANEYTYLGMTIEKDLKMKKTKEKSRMKTKRITNMIFFNGIINGMNAETTTKLWKMTVEPVAAYGSEIWYEGKETEIAQIQASLARRVLGTYRLTIPTEGILGDLGWLRPSVMYTQKRLSYAARLVCGLVSRNVRIVNAWSQKEIKRNPAWQLTTDKLIGSVGMKKEWKELKEGKMKREEWDKLVKVKLMDKAQEDFKKEVNDERKKLRMYGKIKKEIGMEEYPNVLTRRDRRVIVELRCGVAKLEIETGRWSGVARGNRLCKICDLNEVEDELHYTLRCPGYAEERREMVDSLGQGYQEKTEIEKLRFLLTEVGKHKKVMEYLRKTWKKRRQILIEQI